MSSSWRLSIQARAAKWVGSKGNANEKSRSRRDCDKTCRSETIASELIPAHAETIHYGLLSTNRWKQFNISQRGPDEARQIYKGLLLYTASGPYHSADVRKEITICEREHHIEYAVVYCLSEFTATTPVISEDPDHSGVIRHPVPFVLGWLPLHFLEKHIGHGVVLCEGEQNHSPVLYRDYTPTSKGDCLALPLVVIFLRLHLQSSEPMAQDLLAHTTVRAEQRL
ncbi:hypothetical protein QCA50_015372 [Cerrena zonata]|uniref:Uncharacterized protein n=1 Tax=Cerrena zonata TaxID=2478898 RepID=A0AAW0FIV2_9APHY